MAPYSQSKKFLKSDFKDPLQQQAILIMDLV